MEKPTAAEVAAAPKLVERTASANFPPVVKPGSTQELVFAISGSAIHAQSATLEPIEVPQDQKTMILRVGVYAADFDVEAADDPARTWARITVDLVNPDAVAEGRIRHLGQPMLTTAVAAARKRPLGDAFGWRRFDNTDISPLVAVTLAWHAYLAHAKDKPKRVRTGRVW